MKNIWKIIQISKPLHKIAIIIGALILISSSLELAPPILSKFIVDEIINQIQHNGGSLDRLIFLLIATFLLSLLGVILTTASDRLGDHFAGKLRKFLTEKFYDKVLTLPQSYFDGEVSGKIVNQLNRAIQTIQNFINGSTNFMLPTFLQSIFTIIVLAHYSIPIAIFVAILFPIYLWLSFLSTKSWGVREIEKNKYEDLNRGRITEVVGNIKLVKSFNSQLSEFKFIAENLSDINKIYAKQSWVFHMYDFARNFSLILIILGISIVA